MATEIYFFINSILLYFSLFYKSQIYFNYYWNSTILCLLIFYFDKVLIGHWDLFFYFFMPVYFFSYSCLSSYVLLLCLYLISFLLFPVILAVIVFHSCRKTLIHEFLISYSHAEWYFLIIIIIIMRFLRQNSPSFGQSFAYQNPINLNYYYCYLLYISLGRVSLHKGK